MDSYKGLTAIISGGTSGIGKAIAHALGEMGFSLAIIGTNPEKGEKAVSEFTETECRFYPCDVGDLDEIRETFEAIVADFGQADVLVNAAGIPVRSYIEDITPEIWQNFVDVNIRSVFFFSQIFGERIRERGSGYGRIINISSVRAEMYDDFHTGYSLCKAAINSLTKAFAVSYAMDGITTNAIAPGFVATEMTEHYNVGNEKVDNIIKAASPLYRQIEPTEIAALAAYLASRGASATSGQVIRVTGGGNSTPGMYY